MPGTARPWSIPCLNYRIKVRADEVFRTAKEALEHARRLLRAEADRLEREARALRSAADADADVLLCGA